jgi:hypothetical protein
MRLRTAANPKVLPKTKPGALRMPLVVLLIRSRNVARAQRPRIGSREDPLQPLDFGDGVFDVHPDQYLTYPRAGQMLPWIMY